MKKDKTIDLENLDLPLEAYFGSLTPKKRDFSATHLKFKSYRDLLFKLESLLNVSILALDNENSGNYKDIVETGCKYFISFGNGYANDSTRGGRVFGWGKGEGFG